MNIRDLLCELEERPTGKTAEYLAKRYGISIATVKNKLKIINDDAVKKLGFRIVGKSGRLNGYYIEIIDQKKFDFIANSKEELQTIDHNTPQSRVRYILKRLITTSDFIKADEIADELYISKSQFARDMTIVRKILASHHLRIEDKPYSGMKLIGSEFDIRIFIANYSFDDMNEWGNFIKDSFPLSEMEQAIERIREIVIRKSVYYQYKLSDITCQNIIIHLLVALYRINSNMKITLDSKMTTSLRNEEEFPLAVSIVNAVQKAFSVTFNDDEVYYVVVHLSSKKIVDKTNFIVDSTIQKLIDHILERIHSDFDFDFRRDLNLRIMLAMHIAPLLSRIKYGTILQNPLLEQIKENLWFAYDLAICAADVINEQYVCNLSEDEIAYFALHLKIAMDQINANVKKNILLICSTGRGSAELLKQDFTKKFARNLNHLETANVFDLDQIDYSRYDYIFSTVPINKPIPLPVFNISYFIDVGTEGNIQHILSGNLDANGIGQFLKCSFFITDVIANTKEEAIQQILLVLKKTIQLPEEFMGAVLEREELASTDYGNNVAFPHPIKHVTNFSFISVAILKKPIVWKKNKVQMIILSSFEKGFVRKYDGVMQALTDLITNKDYVDKIIESPSYETLMRILKK